MRAVHTIGKDPIFSKTYQLEIFRQDERRVTSLTSGRLFASKMRHVDSKEVMHAVISVVKMSVINTAVPRSQFSVPKG